MKDQPVPFMGAGWSLFSAVFIHFFNCFISHHVKDTFGAGIGRGIGDFDIGEVSDGATESDMGGKDIDAFIDTVSADDRSAQYATVLFMGI